MSAADDGKQKLEEEDVLSSSGRLTRSATDEEKQMPEGEGEDNNKEGEAVLSSQVRTVPSADDKGKQKLEGEGEGEQSSPDGIIPSTDVKLEQGEGADNSKNGEDVLSSGAEISPSADDKGKQILEEEEERPSKLLGGEDVLYFRGRMIEPEAYPDPWKIPYARGSSEEDILAFDRLTLVWVKTRGDKWWPARILDKRSAKGHYMSKPKTPLERPVRLYGRHRYTYADPKVSRIELNKVYKDNELEYRDIFDRALTQELTFVFMELAPVEGHTRYRYTTHMLKIDDLMSQYCEYMANNFDGKEIEDDEVEATGSDLLGTRKREYEAAQAARDEEQAREAALAAMPPTRYQRFKMCLGRWRETFCIWGCTTLLLAGLIYMGWQRP